jgi:hypothetical protein
VKRKPIHFPRLITIKLRVCEIVLLPVKRVATATRRLSNITPVVDKPVGVDNKQSAVSTPVAKQSNSNAAVTKSIGTGAAKTMLSGQPTNAPGNFVAHKRGGYPYC